MELRATVGRARRFRLQRRVQWLHRDGLFYVGGPRAEGAWPPKGYICADTLEPSRCKCRAPCGKLSSEPVHPVGNGSREYFHVHVYVLDVPSVVPMFQPSGMSRTCRRRGRERSEVALLIDLHRRARLPDTGTYAYAYVHAHAHVRTHVYAHVHAPKKCRMSMQVVHPLSPLLMDIL